MLCPRFLKIAVSHWSWAVEKLYLSKWKGALGSMTFPSSPGNLGETHMWLEKNAEMQKILAQDLATWGVSARYHLSCWSLVGKAMVFWGTTVSRNTNICIHLHPSASAHTWHVNVQHLHPIWVCLKIRHRQISCLTIICPNWNDIFWGYPALLDSTIQGKFHVLPVNSWFIDG